MPSKRALKRSDVAAATFLMKWYPKQHPSGMMHALAALIEAERADEREACAKVRVTLKGYGRGYETSDRRVAYVRGWNKGQKEMAAAIRARKEDA